MVTIESREELRLEWPVRRKPFLVPADQRHGTTVHWLGVSARLSAEDDHEQCRNVWRAVQRHHLYTNGWSDIAYSVGVCPHGVLLEGRGQEWDQFGNGEDRVGPNDGDDRVWYSACCLIGKVIAADGAVLSTDEPSAAMLDALGQWVGITRYAGAGAHVLPHSSFQPKDCPGPALHAWIERAGWTEATSPPPAVPVPPPTIRPSAAEEAPVLIHQPIIRVNADATVATYGGHRILDFTWLPKDREEQLGYTCLSSVVVRRVPGGSASCLVFINGAPASIDLPEDGRSVPVQVHTAGLVSVVGTGVVAEAREVWLRG